MGLMFLLAKTGGPGLVAQSSPDPNLPSSGFHASEISVDVVAMDKKGRRITNLRPEEIQISVDGKHVPAGFTDPASSPQAPPQSTPSPQIFRKAAAGSYSNMDSTPVHYGTVIILLSDVMNTPAEQRSKLRDTVMQLLGQMDSNAHVSIYGLTGRLRLLQDYSGDPKVLLAALEKVKKRPAGFSTTMTPETGRILPAPVSSRESPTEFLQTVEDYQTFGTYPEADDRITTTLSALSGIARQFEEIPGRKALLWVADDFPCVFANPILYPAALCGEYGQILSSTLRRIQRAHIAVYPVTAHFQDKKHGEEVQASNDGFERSPNPTYHLPQNTDLPAIFKHDLGIKNSVVNTIAQITGGRVLDINHLQQAVEIARDDCKASLKLTLQPVQEQHSELVKLNITTTRPGISLFFPHQYYAEVSAQPGAPAGASQEEVEDALTSDRPQATGVPLLARKKEGSADIDVTIDAKSLTFHLQKDGSYVIDLDLGVAIFSPGFRLLAANTNQLHRVLSQEKLQQAYYGGLILRVGYPLNQRTRFVRILIHDPGSGKIGTVDVPIECAACNVLH
jgi:VWFA-related protein